jgi:transcriptional/translational regulatory protein YebC/TACO1
VETATDNPTRTVANVRSIFNKAGGSLGTSGSLSFLFDHKSFFKIKLQDGMDLEELEFELIDYGAEELFAEDEVLVIYGQYEAFGSLQKVLEEKGYEILNSGFERIPNDFKEVSPEVQAEIEKMLEKFDDDDDVQNVYHNMKEAE